MNFHSPLLGFSSFSIGSLGLEVGLGAKEDDDFIRLGAFLFDIPILFSFS